MQRAGNWTRYYSEEIKLPTSTPKNIISMFHNYFAETSKTELCMFHVDAEGYDWVIIEAFLQIVTPRIVVFEKNHLSLRIEKDSIKLLQY